MSNVATLTSRSNAELPHVLAWCERMGDNGTLNPASTRLYITAIRKLSDVLDPHEPREAVWFLENLEAIAIRYANVNAANPSTTKTYMSRARTACTSYLEYLENPMGFQPRGRAASKVADDTVGRKKPAKTATPTPAVPTPATEPKAAPAAGNWRDFPLDTTGGRDVKYLLPADGLTSDEAARFACHLLTLCHDFTPSVGKLIVALRSFGQDGITVRE